MDIFLTTLCKACEACPNLITLEPGPDQCENCKQADEQDVRKANEERAKAVKRPNLDKEKHHHNSKSFKSTPSSDKSIMRIYLIFPTKKNWGIV